MPKIAHRAKANSVPRKLIPGTHCFGHGLYLQVTTGGARTWIFRYSLNGRRRDMGLGPYPIITLEAARESAAEAKRMAMDRTDPIEAKRAVAAAQTKAIANGFTFKKAAEEYINMMKSGWKGDRSLKQWSYL